MRNLRLPPALAGILLVIAGVVLGAHASSSWSGFIGKSVGVTSSYAFAGGFVMFLGSSIAGGCTW